MSSWSSVFTGDLVWDERVPVSERVALTAIYRKILDRYFG